MHDFSRAKQLAKRGGFCFALRGMKRDLSQQFRTLSVLGRVPGLPTVWSNCLAGWWLGGGENIWKLSWLLIALTAVYFGAAFLNDASDVDFDRHLNRQRPIVTGLISRPIVWQWGWIFLGIGWLCLLPAGIAAAALGLALTACIIAYNATHRALTISPWLLGLGRFLIYVIAASTGTSAATGLAIWYGLTLGSYATGLGFLMRQRGLCMEVRQWPAVLLLSPMVLAMVANTGIYRQRAILLGMVAATWLAFYLRQFFLTGGINRRITEHLLAGMILVDWMAIVPVCRPAIGFIFVTLMSAALLAQRFIPSF